MNIAKTLLVVACAAALIACSKKTFNPKWTKITAPPTFHAIFETTAGNFEIECTREWSPKAADRLYQLIKSGFYTDNAIFRIDSGFVVQFGISNDTVLNNRWGSYAMPDEKVIKANTEGTISFARGGPESRTTQIFINLKSNSPYLDELAYGGVKGFPAVATVTSGMDVVKKFYSGYKGEPANHQDSIYLAGNTYLKKKYPKLDYIKQAIIKKK